MSYPDAARLAACAGAQRREVAQPADGRDHLETRLLEAIRPAPDAALDPRGPGWRLAERFLAGLAGARNAARAEGGARVRVHPDQGSAGG